MKLKRYEVLADEITASIQAGTRRAGDRLPSVRQTSASRGLSATTVFKAYYLLEARGLIRARDRSGYYVVGKPKALPPELEAGAPAESRRVDVDVSDRVLHVLQLTMRRDVVPFGSAFPHPSLFPHARLARAMASSVAALDPWSSVDDLSAGNTRLRRAIALRYLADGVQVRTEDIVITNGALEALNLCLGAVTRPGDSVLIESPTFYSALQSLERLGLRAIEVPAHPREGIELDALARAIDTHRPAACWLMTNFQNPLGSLMPEGKKRALVELLAARDVPLIEDDVYSELYFGAQRPLPAKAYDESGIVMSCSSFSKSLAPGWRIGWVLGGRYADRILRGKLSLSLSTSAPSQAALATYLEHGGYDRHLRQLRQTLEQQRNQVMEAIARHFPPGTRTTHPDGGYFLWVALPPQVDALAVHRAALSLGVSTAPGPIFSVQDRFRHCLRLNYGHPFDARAQDGLATLGNLPARQC
ncbi:aminotransferase-like domain-containing protein [Bordetella bronchiseptica]